MTDRTRQLFRDLYARLREYEPSRQEVVPAYFVSQHSPRPAMAPTPLARTAPTPRKTLTLAGALTRQRRGEATATDLVRQCLEKIERLDRRLNAFVTWTPRGRGRRLPTSTAVGARERRSVRFTASRWPSKT